MSASRPTRLAEFAAPMRGGRGKFASLTAGLLARKGEALPAALHFSVAAIDLRSGTASLRSEYAGQTLRENMSVAEPQHEHDPIAAIRRPTRQESAKEQRPDIVDRAAMLSPELECTEVEEIKLVSPGVVPQADISSDVPTERGQSAQLSLELGLEVVARLAWHSRAMGLAPAQVIEAALAAHLVCYDNVCPACTRTLEKHSDNISPIE